MKTVVLGLYVGLALTPLFPARGFADPPVRYRLLRGSEFTRLDAATPTVPPARGSLAGSFTMIRQVSPLDWQSYRIEDLSLESPPAFGPAGSEAETHLAMHGWGSYTVGGRGVPQQTVTARVEIDGAWVDLRSATAPPARDWPFLEVELKGSRSDAGDTVAYTVRLVALPELKSWRYQLTGESVLMDECLPCGRVTIPWPLRGHFDLSLYDENPLFSRYVLREVELAVGTGTNAAYRLRGEGFLQIGGEVAVRQTVTLAADLLVGDRLVSRHFTNVSAQVHRWWPMFAVDLDDDADVPTQFFRLRLRAAPFQELWFSTAHGLTSGLGAGPENRVSGGDVLDTRAHVVKSGAHLAKALGVDPGTAGVGIDALTAAPGGELVYSLDADAASPTLGTLQEGDLVSERGRRFLRHQDLLLHFGLMPPVPDVGLDAAQLEPDGEVWFSTRRDVFSERLGTMLRHGDLLSTRGTVRKTNRDLLAAFKPVKPEADYGLDAVHVWPSGEIWFSVAESLETVTQDHLGYGDLLSDQGYVVFRNLDLVGPFQPLEDLADFGLDALFAITDTDAAPTSVLRLVAGTLDAGSRRMTLRWQGGGRVFRVERSPGVGRPFLPAGEWTTETEWIEPAMAPSAGAIYRVRHW